MGFLEAASLASQPVKETLQHPCRLIHTIGPRGESERLERGGRDASHLLPLRSREALHSSSITGILHFVIQPPTITK